MDCVCVCVQDVLFPVECVRVAGGYIVHEVTAADTLRIGDQLELHVDEVMLIHTHIHTEICSHIPAELVCVCVCAPLLCRLSAWPAW